MRMTAGEQETGRIILAVIVAAVAVLAIGFIGYLFWPAISSLLACAEHGLGYANEGQLLPLADGWKCVP